MARKPKKGQDAPMPFPLAGLDSSDPHDKQRPLTTRDGENVQSFDMLENRARGGSRPGLSRYVTDPVAELNSPVQCLTFVVAISDEAMLDDDGYLGGNSAPGFTPGGGGGGGGDGDGAGPSGPLGPGPGDDGLIPDGSTGNGRRRKPPGGRTIRRGGSGVRPTRNGKQQSQPPIARPDTATAYVNGSSLLIDILGNDFYIGEPTFTLLSRPSGVGTTGAGTGKRVTYTPPTSGDGGYTVLVPYRLTAKGNRGSSNSVLTIAVAPVDDPHYPPGTYTGRVDSVELGDGYLGVQITYDGNPLPSTNLFFTANGPGTGSSDPTATNIFTNSANNFASVLPGLGIIILITGPADPPPGFIGTLGIA